MPIRDFVSPHVYALGGPGSGRRPGGLSQPKPGASTEEHVSEQKAHDKSYEKERDAGNKKRAGYHADAGFAHEASAEAEKINSRSAHSKAAQLHKAAKQSSGATAAEHEYHNEHQQHHEEQAKSTQKKFSLSSLVSPAVYALSAKADGYDALKKSAEDKAGAAMKSGKHEDYLAASEAHKTAAEKAPSDEEREAHLDIAARNLRRAATAMKQKAETPAEKCARELKENANKQEMTSARPYDFANISPAVRDGYAMSAEGCKWTKIREAVEKQGKKLTPQGIKKLSAMSQKQIDALKEKEYAAFCMSTIEEPALSLLAFSGAAFYALPGIEGPNNAANEREGLPNPAGPKALTSLKDVLSTGKYTHPIHGWSLDVTPDKIKKYCAAFSEMKNAGVKVPIYADHKPGAANTLGYVKDMFQGGPDAIKNHPEFAKLPVDRAPLDPNKMYAVHEWASPEAMKMAHGVGQVSVLIDKKMQDGTGKKYGEATRHVAVTPEPIVPGQGGFTQLAASLLDGVPVGLYALAN